MTKSHRFIKAVGLILVLSLVMAGCVGVNIQNTISSSDSEKSETITITFLHYFSDVLDGGIKELVSQFNDGQDEYMVKSIPIDHEAFKISIIKSFEAKNPPDIYSYWAGARTKSIREYLTPIDDIWSEYDLTKTFQPSIIDSAVKVDGHYYLLPITQHYVAFFYNKKIFEDLRLNPPQTWDEFLNVCEIIKNDDKTPISLGAKSRWPAQFWFDYILLRTAGKDYRDKLMNGEAKYTDPEVVRAFAIWSDLIDKGYFNEDAIEVEWYDSPMGDIVNGKAAMTLMGTWCMSSFKTLYNFDPGDDYGYFTFPIIDEGVKMSALGPIDGLVVPKDAVNTDGAKEVLVFLANSESQKIMALGSGAFSPSSDVDTSIYNNLQIKMLEDINQQPDWSFNYDLATPPEIADLGLDLFIEFLELHSDYEYLLHDMEKAIHQINQ